MGETTTDRSVLEFGSGRERMLGFRTGISPRRFRSADTVQMKRVPGFSIGPQGQITPWPAQQLTEIDGEMVVLGPWLEGTTPIGVSRMKPRDFRLIAAAARHLSDLGFPLGGFYRRAFRKTAEGGLLVFPPVLAAWMRELVPQEELQRDWECWNHPDLSGEEAWSFSLGTLAWTMIAGRDPYEDEVGERRRERVRRGAAAPLEYFVPETDPELARMTNGSLGISGTRRGNLEAWEGIARRWTETGGTGAVSEEKKSEIRGRARRGKLAMERRLRFRRWFRRSGWKFLGAVAAAGLAAGFLSAPIRQALREPVTAGMPPLEVAETYYRGISELDSTLMADCLGRGVGREDRRQVDTIFVTHRVRQGYEGLPDLPSAADWLAEGRPALPPGVWPWGITDLELTALGDGSIKASYRFWVPREEESADGEAIGGLPRIDILTFEKAKRSWRITRIERITGN